MKIIKIQKLERNCLYDYYKVSEVENNKLIKLYFTGNSKGVFDIILQNIKDFKEIELRFFLNEFNRRKKIDRHQINLFVKSNYETIFLYFTSVVDYDYLEVIIVTTLNNLKPYDRMSVKF